ncbi:phosphatidic acid phosphatase type [Mortierella sp. AD011]|nr:phosphatidic acid phosphatase type [Mortierella sp. AD011]
MHISRRTKDLIRSYGKDWALVIVVLAAFSYIDTLEPYHRQFSVKDITIQHPFAKKETVPVWLALVWSILQDLISFLITYIHKNFEIQFCRFN